MNVVFRFENLVSGLDAQKGNWAARCPLLVFIRSHSNNSNSITEQVSGLIL